MKKITTLGAVLLLTVPALAKTKYYVECKAQLARSSEAHTELLPKLEGYDSIKISKEGTAAVSYTYSLNDSTDRIYRLDLSFKTKDSNWSFGATAFTMDAQIWDVKNNKLVGVKTETSDNVRTRFLLSQLLEEDIAKLVTDIPSFEFRNKLLTSSNAEIAELAKAGKWEEANKKALSLALVHPFDADFASVDCFIKN